jgi:hypothetical protein
MLKQQGRLLARAGTDRATMQRLLAEGQLVEVEYGGHTFVVRQSKPIR